MIMQTFERFTIAESAIMLVDHQTMTIDWVKSLPRETVVASCRVLARMATTYGMPLVLTTTMEEYVGPTIGDISELAPDAFASRYKRGGALSCWDDPRLCDGVKGLGRSQLVLAGLTTDICLFWAAVDAVKNGYRVMVVADACGAMTTLGDQLTQRASPRLRHHRDRDQPGRHRARQRLRDAGGAKGSGDHVRRDHLQARVVKGHGAVRRLGRSFRCGRDLDRHERRDVGRHGHAQRRSWAAVSMIWLKAWGVGLLVSFPTASLVVPPVVCLTARLHTDPDDDRPLPR